MKIFKYFVPVAILLFFSYSSAGEKLKVADSLRQALHQNIRPDQRQEALEALAWLFHEKSLDSNVKYGTMAIHLAQKQNNKIEEVRSYSALIGGFIFFDKKDSSRKYLAIIDHIREGSKDPKVIFESFNSFVTYYENTKQFDSAMYYLVLAKEAADKSGDFLVQASASGAMGEFFIRRKKYDKALIYCLEALKHKKMVDSIRLTSMLTNIGNIYFWQKDYKKAKEYYVQAYENAKKSNTASDFGFTLNNIGLVLAETFDYPMALRYFHLSLKQYQLFNNHLGITTAMGNMAEVFYNTEKFDSAIFYSRKVLTEAALIHDFRHIENSYVLLSEIYNKKKDFFNAFENMKLAKLFADSLTNLEMERKVSDLNVRYETTRQERENKLLRERDAMQQSRFIRQRIIGITLIILLLSCFYMLSNISKSRRKLKAMHDEISLQKAQLEKEAEFRLKLFSIVSHDFRSPISTLQGYLYLLENNLMEPDETRKLTIDMNNQLQVTADFAENLLNWSASQLNGFQPDISEINLSEMVDKTFSLYQKSADLKGIRLENSIAFDARVMADHDFIRLVLRNLVSNAIKFTEKGFVKVSSELKSGEHIIHVTDSGSGISAEAMQLLFTDAAKATEGTANEMGSGLGLMLCKEFIKANGGKIWVESKIGKGSVFSFSIPI